MSQHESEHNESVGVSSRGGSSSNRGGRRNGAGNANGSASGRPHRRWCFTIHKEFDESHVDNVGNAVSRPDSVFRPAGESGAGRGADEDGDGDPIVEAAGSPREPLERRDVSNADIWQLQFWRLPDPPHELIRGAVYQYEIAPSTGRIHVQGYVELHRPTRLKQLKDDVLGAKHAHCEPANGDAASNIAYCTKSDTRFPGSEPECVGTLDVSQGKRTDIADAVGMLREGKPMHDVLESAPDVFVKYHRGLTAAREITLRRNSMVPRLQLRVKAVWGAAGVGKTRTVYEKHGYEEVYTVTAPSGADLWWDGYEGQKVLLIDDFYGWIKYGFLLKVLDIYPLRLAIKGGHTYAAWERVYLTSNKAPETWYSGGMTQALSRRIHETEHIAGAGEGEGDEGQYARGFVPPPRR